MQDFFHIISKTEFSCIEAILLERPELRLIIITMLLLFIISLLLPCPLRGFTGLIGPKLSLSSATVGVTSIYRSVIIFKQFLNIQFLKTPLPCGFPYHQVWSPVLPYNSEVTWIQINRRTCWIYCHQEAFHNHLQDSPTVSHLILLYGRWTSTLEYHKTFTETPVIAFSCWWWNAWEKNWF